MSEQHVPRVRLSEPGDIAQIAPALIGFQPEESLVIMALERSRVVVTARVDIDAVHPPREAEHLLDRIWSRFPDANAYLMAYTSRPEVGWSLLKRCGDHLATDSNSMLVNGDTWYTPDGNSGAVDRYGRVAAEMARHGVSAHRRRADLDALYACAPDSALLDAQLVRAVDELPSPTEPDAVVTKIRQLIERNLPGADPTQHHRSQIGLTDALHLAILTQSADARDVALLSMTDETAERHLRMWRQVVNQTPSYAAEMPLYLAGMAAWMTGDGATAVVALERSLAVADSPSQIRPAALLDTIIDRVVPPNAWPEMRQQMLRDAPSGVRRAVADIEASEHPAPTQDTGPSQLRRQHRRQHDRPMDGPGRGIAI